MSLIRMGLVMLAETGVKIVAAKAVSMAGKKIRDGLGEKQPRHAGTIAPEKGILTKIVGLTEKKGKKLAQEAGWAFRVVSRDGEGMIVTMDLRNDRINAYITKGKITSVYVG